MKILIFVEPVEINDRPSYHDLWVNIFLDLFKDTSDVILGLQSSSSVCARFVSSFNYLCPINAGDVLRSNEFSKHLYVDDVVRRTNNQNEYLIDIILRADDDFQPDIVFSWTDNVYLRAHYQNRCVFVEYGPLPRYLFEPALHFDPFRTCNYSSLQMHCDPEIRVCEDNRLFEYFHERWASTMRQWASLTGLQPWIENLGKDKLLTLLVLQPSNDFSWLSSRVLLDEVTMIRAAAARDPMNELVIPMWHPGNTAPDADLVKQLQDEHSNLRIPPEGCRVGVSEMAINFVDGVVTGSSNVAFLASIMGKRLRVLGDCRFSFLDTSKGPAREPRVDLLRFATWNYCWSLKSIKEDVEAFLDHLGALKRYPKSVFLDWPMSDLNQLERFLPRQ